MEEKIKMLKAGFRKNSYICKLALLDHIRECLEKDNYLKATDTPKDAEGYKNLDKELMDLKIILDFYFDGKEDLHEKRLNKFIDNMNKE